MAEVQGGIHDVQVLAADSDVVVEATHHLAPGGVVNLFAGLKRERPHRSTPGWFTARRKFG